MSKEKGFPAKVSEIIDNKTIVINRGSADNIKKGDTFLIYSIGKEIIDPDSGESLGKLEIVKGKASVLHIQEHITTLKSSQIILPDKKIIYKKPLKNVGFLSFVTGIEETKEEIQGEEEILPFDNVQVGDLVKPI